MGGYCINTLQRYTIQQTHSLTYVKKHIYNTIKNRNKKKNKLSGNIQGVYFKGKKLTRGLSIIMITVQISNIKLTLQLTYVNLILHKQNL